MSDVKFTDDHEWVAIDGDIGTVGITDYAQGQLGDVVYVELPAVGAEFAKSEEAAVVESVKAASEIYAPVSGAIVEVNGALSDNPALVNDSAMTNGWFFKTRLSDPSELDEMMDEAAYAAFVEGLD